MRKERLHGFDFARTRGGHQSRFAAGKHRIWIGASLQQQLDDLTVAVCARNRERGHAVAVGGLHICARPDQKPRRLEIILLNRPVQSRAAVSLGRIHVRMLLEQRADSRPIHPFGGFRKTRVGSRGTHRRRGQQKNDRPFREHSYTESGLMSSLMMPWLSANLSRWTPTFSSSVKCKLDRKSTRLNSSH